MVEGRTWFVTSKGPKKMRFCCAGGWLVEEEEEGVVLLILTIGVFDVVDVDG